jgi:hypothetical protein
MSKIWTWVALTMVAVGAWAAAVAGRPLARRDIDLLVRNGRLNDAAYWRERLVEGGKLDGARVAALLTQLARVLRPDAKAENAVAVLAEFRILGAPEYWNANAVAGRTCEARNVAMLLGRVASRMPVERPRSAGARPLEATPPERLRGAYDVIVAGAGTGGSAAAAQAARMGRTVLLLEETDWIGGQMNAAAVTSMDEGGTLVRERGVYREWCGLVASHYQPLGVNYITAYNNGHVCFEPRVGRRLLHALLGDAKGTGVLDLALRSRVVKVARRGETVTGVEIENTTAEGRKRRAVACRVLIDATEWGDVIPLTGARYRVGNRMAGGGAREPLPMDRAVQANTWTAVVKQYPEGAPQKLRMREAPPGYTDAVHAGFARTLVAGERYVSGAKPWNWANFVAYRAMPDTSRPGDTPPFTRTHLNYNNDCPSTVAEIESPERRLQSDRAMRLKTLHLLYYIQHTLGKADWSVADDEGYDTPYNREQIDAWLRERPELTPYREILYRFSVAPYVRESRRIVGLHTLTAREIERAKGKPVQFAHTVALGDYAVDLHGSMRKELLEPELDRESDIPNRFGARGTGPFAIPFECFIPERVDGLVAAEKNISQSRLANGATRLQPSTMLMGQAAGAIAALAVAGSTPPRRVDPAAVQRVLLEAGATLAIEDVGVEWGTPEWRSRQAAALRAGAPAKAVE